MPRKRGRRSSVKVGVRTPVAPKKRMGMSAKKATPTSQVLQCKQSHRGSREGDSEVMDVLLHISSRLQATEAYIASQQENEKVTCTRAFTQQMSAKGSRRGSNLPATSVAENAAANVYVVVREKVTKQLNGLLS